MTKAALVATLSVLLAATALAASCTETLGPTLIRELPLATFKQASGIAWLDGDNVAVGSEYGVFRYNLPTGAKRALIGSQPIPIGMPHVEDVASDGKTLVAFSRDYGDVAARVEPFRIVNARRFPAMQILDVAVQGDTVFVLGFPLIIDREKSGVLWTGKVGGKWSQMRLVHKVSEEATRILRSGFAPYGGAMTTQTDGTIAIITAAEPGVMRFRMDGTPLPVLGDSLSELVITRLPEIRLIFAEDVVAQYREVINIQPIADDLIETSEGLAIVVRRAERGFVSWELWFPPKKGSPVRRIRLSLQDNRIVGGHLRCQGRGKKIACLFGTFTQIYQSDRPHVVIFDMDSVTRQCGG
jgi:hypothetical protein